ncbi:hypothetical protein GCM10017655_30960 [Pseudomonas turukhanskensis]|uniref:Uncharacterized protein n=1 Tax=Pseudomonas turukhanskensis TaxID=1806536 RepID=A0A9W6K9N3_9PSED|nr:hypothetical protein GCM10017655_30960 [Pseudomonas turukhanskensis]
MSNLDIYLPLVDGSACWPVAKGDLCKDAIQTVFSDDWGAPPRALVIKVLSGSGKEITVYIPYDNNGKASVQIDGEQV